MDSFGEEVSVDENALPVRHVFEKARDEVVEEVHRLYSRAPQNIVNTTLNLFARGLPLHAHAAVSYFKLPSISRTHTLALAFPYCSHLPNTHLFLASLLLRHLQLSQWRAKDILFLFPSVEDCAQLSVPFLAAVLDSYPSMIDQALIFSPSVHTLSVDPVSHLGLVSNLDLYALFYIYAKGYRKSLYPSNMMDFMDSQWSAVIHAAESRIQDVFFRRRIDTVKVGVGQFGTVLDLHRSGMLEISLSSVRALNNLIEKLHHSSTFYILAGAGKFIPISRYIYILLAPILALLYLAQSLRMRPLIHLYALLLFPVCLGSFTIAFLSNAFFIPLMLIGAHYESRIKLFDELLINKPNSEAGESSVLREDARERPLL